MSTKHIDEVKFIPYMYLIWGLIVGGIAIIVHYIPLIFKLCTSHTLSVIPLWFFISFIVITYLLGANWLYGAYEHLLKHYKIWKNLKPTSQKRFGDKFDVNNLAGYCYEEYKNAWECTFDEYYQYYVLDKDIEPLRHTWSFFSRYSMKTLSFSSYELYSDAKEADYNLWKKQDEERIEKIKKEREESKKRVNKEDNIIKVNHDISRIQMEIINKMKEVNCEY